MSGYTRNLQKNEKYDENAMQGIWEENDAYVTSFYCWNDYRYLYIWNCCLIAWAIWFVIMFILLLIDRHKRES